MGMNDLIAFFFFLKKRSHVEPGLVSQHVKEFVNLIFVSSFFTKVGGKKRRLHCFSQIEVFVASKWNSDQPSTFVSN
jgi:hypothetical protein